MSDIDQSPEAEGAEQAATEADAVLGDTAADPADTIDTDAEADAADTVAAGAEPDQDAATDAVETELDEDVEGETVPEGDETVAEDELAESALETSGEAPEGAPAEEAAADEAAAPAIDPIIAFKRQLRKLPGDWFVIHSYAGYENKVKANLETRAVTLGAEDKIFQVEVPVEEFTEVKNGQKKVANRKVLPG